MDPCEYVRLTVSNLALKIPVHSKPARNVIHPSSSPCFCVIKLKGFPPQNAVVPLLSTSSTPTSSSSSATFHLSKDDVTKLASKPLFAGKIRLKISIYTGRTGATCGVTSGRRLGKVSVPLDLKGTECRAVIFHNGWTSVGGGEGVGGSQFHVSVRADPDPRFVFQFDGEPECSPQVFQIKGTVRQPVFTCNFGFRQPGPAHRHQRSRSLQSEQGSGRGWLSTFGSERERPGKERKGWSITVHDLSGSPVAAASMVTPFVASPGSDRVSRSNPGSWLILRPGDNTWKPWGRLEAWRERGGPNDGLGYRFELIPEMGTAGGNNIVLAEATLSSAKGGKFSIDLGHTGSTRSGHQSGSPGCSPRGGASGEFGVWGPRGFVMSARVEGEGKKCSKPTVEVSVQHVTCTEDAAAYVALAAAVDLSMDACRLFSQKLRKELCPQANDLDR